MVFVCFQDGNQYVVLEVIQLNDAGRADSNQVVSDIQEEDEDEEDEEEEVGEEIVIKKEFDVKPKMSTRKGKGQWLKL